MIVKISNIVLGVKELILREVNIFIKYYPTV